MLIQNLFNLDKAIKWIEDHSFKCVALELPNYLLKRSVDLTKFLNSRLKSTEFYTIVLNCCSVDYVSPRHLNGQIDSIIRFGRCCLSSLPKGIVEYPVLFMFENHFHSTDNSDRSTADFIINELNNLNKSLLIIDTNYLIPTLDLIKNESKTNETSKSVSFAKYIKFTEKWTIVDKASECFIDHDSNLENRFYNYVLDRKLDEYKKIYFIGDRIPNSIKILSLLEVFHLNPTDRTSNRIQTNRELMKRCSLIEKVKKLNKFGVVFSHSYPHVSPFIEEIKKLCRKKRKQINFITLVQTTDEFKLGNFSALESLVLISACYCSNLIDTISLHVPLINYTEFKISCGLKEEYGQVRWNEEAVIDEEESTEDNESSMQLLLDDRNTALVENYLKEDRWFGLKVNAGQDEISELKQGLKGIAMEYNNDRK